MYTESGPGKTEDKPNSPHNVELPSAFKDPILHESMGKLAELRRVSTSSSLIGGEKKIDAAIKDALAGLSREEQIALLRSFTETHEQIEKNLTEAQKVRIEQIQIFSTLLTSLQNVLDGQNDAAFSSMNLWLAKKFQGADMENLKQFLTKFDPVDVSTYLIQNKDRTLYHYMKEKYPGQIDMLKRLTYHSAIPFDGTVWGQQNGKILADVQNKTELTRYKTEVVSSLRSDDSLGHYEMARSLAIEGLRGKFEALKEKIDERKIREETDQKMKKEFGHEWETTTLTALKTSPENKEKTVEELHASISSFRHEMEEQTFKHLKEKSIGQMIFDSNDFSGYSLEEKALWDEYNDSMGFGTFDLSDEKWDSIAKEFAINAPLILISGGFANVAVKGLSIGARAILPEVIAQVGTRVGTRISAYVVGKLALKTAQIALEMGIEGTSFEIVHHALSEGDLNMFNERGWQSKILWSSLTLGAFKGVGKLQQTALLRSFAEKIATGASEIAQIKGLNKVLAGFPVGMQAGFGKILYGLTAFEASRQMEASVMFLTGAAQATLSGQDLDNFYTNLYDYCVANGGDHYFHAMISAHALNLAHTATSAIGKKLKAKLEQNKTSDKVPEIPSRGSDKNDAEIQKILSGELLPAIQKEIREAGNEAAQNTKRLEIAEQTIQKLRGNDSLLTYAEKQAIIDTHNIPPTDPDGTYSSTDIVAKTRKLAEIFPGNENKNIREALIRNGVCGNFDVFLQSKMGKGENTKSTGEFDRLLRSKMQTVESFRKETLQSFRERIKAPLSKDLPENPYIDDYELYPSINGIPAYISEVAQTKTGMSNFIMTNKKNIGWKFHLNVTPENVAACSEYLKKNGYSHKYLSGGKEGKTFTVYIGSEKLAKELSHQIAHNLEGKLAKPHVENKEIEFAPGVVGRFVATGDGTFRSYGTAGFSWIDVSGFGPEDNKIPLAQKNQWEETSFNALHKLYGDYFTSGK